MQDINQKFPVRLVILHRRKTRILKLIFLTFSYRFLHPNYLFRLALYLFQSTYSICPHETSLKNILIQKLFLLFTVLIICSYDLRSFGYSWLNKSIDFSKDFLTKICFFLKRDKTIFKTKYHLNYKYGIFLLYIKLIIYHCNIQPRGKNQSII